MKIVDVDHLSFEYGNRRVLHNLNFSIRQGDYAVLTGENGSGKSTLMKVLSGELDTQIFFRLILDNAYNLWV